MSVVVEERASNKVRCHCGALLRYNPEDVRRDNAMTAARVDPSDFRALNGGGWSWILCPECKRACVVSGCW